MLEVDDHIAAGLDEVGFLAGAEKTAVGHVVEVLGLVAAAHFAVLQGAEMLGVGLRVVRCDVLEDVLRGSITAGPGPDFGNDSPYLFTPMYEASFKGTKR